MKKLLLLTAIISSILFTGAQCVTNVNFSSWQQGGQPGNGNWSLQNGGTQIYQSVNGNPSFFYSPFDMMNVHISGEFRSTDTDDDYMGFVFSFLNPLGATDSFDCWLFDWKQANQGGAPSGKSLNRVNGVVTPADYNNQFWNHQNSAAFTVVQNDFGGNGWGWLTWHNFDLYLTYTNATIYVDGALVFDQQDCFKPGRFGFYNLSQRDCYYRNFQYEVFVDFQFSSNKVCLGDPVQLQFLNPCVPTFLNQYQSVTWNYGDGTSNTVNNPTFATINATHTYTTAGTYTATLTVTDFNGCSSSATQQVEVRNPISLSPTIVQPACNGASTGSVGVTAINGFGNYQYSWNGGANTQATWVGVTAGTYTVSVTDGYCAASAQYTVNQPTALSATTSHTDAPCGLNGTATIVVSGGTPPYTGVNWAGFPGSTVSLPAGTWIADFHDANGCSALLQYTETITSLPCGLTSSTSVVNVSCFNGSNGSATLTVTGSTAPVNITWSNGATGSTASGLAAGTYTYNYSDGNAAHAFSGSVTITQPGAAMVAQLATTAISCAGSSNGQAIASVLSGGNTPYSYAWSGGQANNPVASNLGPGAITVTVTDGSGCTATATGNVSGVPSLATSFVTVMDSCFHAGRGSATVRVTGGSAPYTYAWNNFATDTTNANIIEGTYSVTVTDFNGCTTSGSATVPGPANPLYYTSAIQHVNCTGDNTGTYSITPTGGTPGYTYQWNPNVSTGNSLTGLTAGIYSFTMTDSYACTVIGGDTVEEPATALSATSAHTDVTCNGAADGTITLTLSGGTAPYTYLGNPVPAGTNTLPGLAAGTYAGNVVDFKGCTVALSETITEPALLTVTEIHTNVACNAASTGGIDITVAGGTTPYTYAWNDGVTTQDRSTIPAGTYGLTVTDFNACTATISVTISQPTALALSETHTNVLCNGAGTGAIDLTASGGTTTYSYSWNDGVITEDRTGIPASTYSVTVSDLNFCTATISVAISEPAALTVTTSHTNVTCNGLSNGTVTVNISGGTAPYAYLGNPIPAGTTTVPNLPANTYAGNVVDGNGCSVSVSETITEPGPQSVTVTGNNNPCFGVSLGDATANFVNATGTVTYNWTGGLTGSTISTLAAGTYTVTATDQNTCTVTNSITITQPAAVNLNVAVTNALCNGANGSATANPVGGTAPFNYAWSNSATGQTIPVPAGTYTVTSTDAIGCQQTGSGTITEPAGITFQQANTNVLCFGGNTGTSTLTVSGGAGPAYTFTWSPNVSSTNTASNLTAGTYNVTVADAAACPLDTFIVITEPATALADSVDKHDVFCFGQNNGTIDLITSGGTGPYTYTWSPNVSSTSSANGLSAGTYDITVNDANLCSLTESVSITEPTALTFTQAQTDLTCFGVSTGTASVTVAGGTTPYTYTWTSAVSTTNSATALAAGVYNVTMTDNSLCTITATFTLTQPTQLTVTETHTNNLCAGTATAHILTTAIGGTPAYTYQWNPAVSTNDSAVNLTAGTYDLTVTDQNTCTVTLSTTITSPAVLDITATATDALCFGDNNGTVTAVATGGTNPYNYTLTSDGVNFQNSGTGQYTALAAATYAIVVTDNNTCADSTTITVNQPLEITSIVTATDVSCFGYTDGTITVQAAGGQPNFTFALSSGGQNGTGAFTNLATGNYTVTITDANNCSISDVATILEPAPVSVTATPNPVVINLGESIQLQTTTSQTGTVTYNWTPSFGLSCYDCPAPVFSGNYSVDYTVNMSTAAGCTGSSTISVTVVPNYNIFIPNAFTPNGDGANDLWSIYGNLPGIKQLNVMVFNRWGEKVFESDDLNFAWDGTYRGTKLPPAVYTYVARFVWLNNHTDADYKGTITIIK